MHEPSMRFPTTCPECSMELLTELPIAIVAHALMIGKEIRLHARCHDRYWTATFLERGQLREYLGAMRVTGKEGVVEARP